MIHVMQRDNKPQVINLCFEDQVIKTFRYTLG